MAGGSRPSAFKLIRVRGRMASQAKDMCGGVRTRESAVLMARVVDGAGVAVRCADVEAIRYAMHRVDAFWSRNDLLTAFGRGGIALDVCDVFFDSLQTGGS